MVETPQIILIDGPAGSGKTTVAAKIQEELKCQIINLDTIYNGWDDALGQSLTDKLIALVESFLAKRTHQLPTFNWHEYKYDYDALLTVPPNTHLIIEGVGAGQSAIRPKAAKLYWVEAPDEIGIERVITRDRQVIKDIEIRIQQWKIREAAHFEVERTRDFADFIITTT